MIIPACTDKNFMLHPADEKKLDFIENEGNVVYEKRSQYSNIKVIDTDKIKLLLFDDSYQGGLIKYKRFQGGLPYTRYFHLGKVINPDIKNILILGLGAGSVLKDAVHLYDYDSIDVVEIDPAVEEVARTYFGLHNLPGVKIHIQEGRHYVQSTKKKYDLVILDIFVANGLLFDFLTKEFIAEVSSILTDNGIVSLNTFVLEDLSGVESNLFKAMVKTYQTCFSNIYAFPVHYGSYEYYREVCSLRYALGRVTNIIMLACKGNVNLSKEDFLKDVKKLKANSGLGYLKNIEYYARDYLDIPFTTDNIKIIEEAFKEDKRFSENNFMEYLDTNIYK